MSVLPFSREFSFQVDKKSFKRKAHYGQNHQADNDYIYPEQAFRSHHQGPDTGGDGHHLGSDNYPPGHPSL
jgi:hypothetical protein